MEVRFETIPAHIVYTAEYDVETLNDFFDEETGANILMDLDIQMRSENPDVHIPEEPDDYNYMVHQVGEIPGSPVHVIYCDMVDKKGTDNPDGAYVFKEMPEVYCAVYEFKGPFEKLGEGFKAMYGWLEENGYTQADCGRSSYIHGPWDTENHDDYVVEIQIPVTK